MKTILIVEDEQTARKALSEKLTNEGYKTIEAQNGKIGLEKALEENPDLILLDMVMPIMDGITMLEKLRKDKWGSNAKVILLTNLTDNDIIARAREERVSDYLIKSNWHLSDLIEKIEKNLMTTTKNDKILANKDEKSLK